jgi:hypothetical protein
LHFVDGGWHAVSGGQGGIVQFRWFTSIQTACVVYCQLQV